MNKIFIIAVLAVTIFTGCKKSGKPGCGMLACTAVYVQVGVQCMDSTGKGVDVTDLKVLNLRTRKILTSPPVPSTNAPQNGRYTIASDYNLKDLSTTGDDLQVSATNSVTGQTITVIEKVSGGECNCHVARVSGPEVIKFP